MKLDLKNKKILDILRNNCRLNHTEIGKIVGLSRESVSYRIKKLEKAKIIRGHYTFINYDLTETKKYVCFIKFNNFEVQK